MPNIVRVQFTDDGWLSIDMDKINHIHITPESAILYLDGTTMVYKGEVGTPGYGGLVNLDRHWRRDVDEATKQAIANLRCAVFLKPGDTAHD
jgi:hypothetical protein